MTALWHPFADMHGVSQREFVVERGEGVHVFDADGRRYLDGTASLWYSNLGYGRREITEAVATQMDKLGAYHTFADFSNPPANALAERLARYAPMDDAKVFLASGGGDAVDTAAKIARRHWVQQGRPERAHIISRGNAYHGTHGFGIDRLHCSGHRRFGLRSHTAETEIHDPADQKVDGCVARLECNESRGLAARDGPGRSQRAARLCRTGQSSILTTHGQRGQVYHRSAGSSGNHLHALSAQPRRSPTPAGPRASAMPGQLLAHVRCRR